MRTALLLALSACTTRIQVDDPQTPDAPPVPAPEAPAETDPPEPPAPAEEEPTAPPPGTLVPPASIASESSVCWTVRSSSTADLELLAVGMDSGTVVVERTFPTTQTTSSWRASGLAYDGQSTLVAASHNANAWFVFDLATTTVTADGQAGFQSTVTWHDGAWIATLDAFDPFTFPDVAALRQGAGDPLDIPFPGSRYQAFDGIIYNAWHSTDRLEPVDAATGAVLTSILLEGYDTWVQGIGITPEHLHVIDDGRSDQSVGSFQIWRFDHDGTLVNTVPIDGRPAGLWCE